MKVLVGVCVYNELGKIQNVLKELKKVQDKEKFDVIVCSDGSTDGSLEYCIKECKKNEWFLISHKSNTGIGSSIRDMINYGIKNNYGCFVTIPGNGKIKPKDIKLLYKDVVNNKYDYVKGSRYLDNAECNNLPIFRKIFIPIYSLIVSILMCKRITDVTCLVNAQNLNIYNNKLININQTWLNKYELEYYVLYYILKLKYKFIEVPIDVNYPITKKNYTKIKPFSGWWSMIKPWIVLKLKIKS